MKRLLVVAAVFFTAVSLALCVAETIRGAALPVPADGLSCVVVRSSSVYRLRCNGLAKQYPPIPYEPSSREGYSANYPIASRYVITNVGSSGAVTAHDFFDELDQPVGQVVDTLGLGEAKVFNLADIGMIPSVYTGYAIISADQPITGMVLPEPPEPPVFYTYLPFVIKQPPLPPLSLGETVRFSGAWDDVPLQGEVILSEYRGVLEDTYRGPVYPGGVFLVTVMDVTNYGLISDEVGTIGSFKVRDSAGRQFDIADLEVLWAAEDEYGYESVYEAIQPGFTKRLVFVFDVLPGSTDLHLMSLSPW